MELIILLKTYQMQIQVVGLYGIKRTEIRILQTSRSCWSNMKSAVRKYEIHKFHETRGGKDCIHPTQKPVSLYKWLLDKYATCGECGGEGEIRSMIATDCDYKKCPKCKSKQPLI